MRRERSAFQLYTDLAGLSDAPKIKALFVSLAQEEASHKLHLELVYDDLIR